MDTEVCKMWGSHARGGSIPTAGDKPAEEMENVPIAVEEECCTTAGCFLEKFVSRYFYRLVVENRGGGVCVCTVNSILLLLQMDL